MTIIGRSRETIRTSILAEWRTRYASLGITIRRDRDSDAYREADAVALDLARVEAMVEETAPEVMPDSATGAVKARLRLTVTGTDGVRRVLGRVWTSSAATGSREFVPLAETVTLSGRSGSLDVEARVAGTESTLSVGASVTIDLAVTGLDSAAKVASVLRDGATADGSMLARHGTVEGLVRQPATATEQEFTVTGTDATVTVGSSVLVAPNGLRYEPVAATFAISGGTGIVRARSTTKGANTVQATGTILTWSSAPTGVNPTATASATVPVTGTDEESDGDYAARIILRRRARPASGNSADWCAWAIAHDYAVDAYCYPLLDPDPAPNGTPNQAGHVTTVALGPRPGTNAVPPGSTKYRIMSSASATAIKNFIEGTHDASGNAIVGGKRLRPETIDPNDYAIEPAVGLPTDVDVSLTLDADNAFPWTGVMLEDTLSTPTTLSVVGNQTAKNGKEALVYVGTTYARGGYQKVTLGTGVFGGGSTVWTFSANYLLNTPTGTVYPASPNWDALRRAVFDYFDNLGPGSADASSWRGRFPFEAMGGQSTVYVSAIKAALMNVPGVVNLALTTPAVDVAVPPKSLATLNDLTLH